MVCLDDFTRITVGEATVFHGSNLDVLPFMADNSVDSIVTDPPYELGFMGKKWDSSGIAYSVELWVECLRVLKPGGHLLAFGGSRTWHRLAVAIEDAGFEVRDSIAWLYGSGFPKSHDISKAIDKAAGAEREVVTDVVESLFGVEEVKREKPAFGIGATGDTFNGHAEGAMFRELGEPATSEAQKWSGWGTALKPAFEPVVVARKPLIGTVAENTLTWGVGGLNIDASRIGSNGGTKKIDPNKNSASQNAFGTGLNGGTVAEINAGRWPANIILDEYTAELLDEQSGILTSGGGNKSNKQPKSMISQVPANPNAGEFQVDKGGASRFFYVAKASKRDRNEGLDELPEVQTIGGGGTNAELDENGYLRTDSAGGKYGSIKAAKQNFHPTVKPTDLMRYLIKLVTPAGGTVLDPFTGSGSTGKAALLDGYKFIGIELTDDYLPIIQGRLEWANQQAQVNADKENEKLF